MQYFALIGDIVKSREIEHRGAVQSRLIETMRTVNARFGRFVVSDLMVNAGDSFQGILSSDAPVLCICDAIRFSLAPYCKVRMGIGYGTIATAIDAHASILADGPAFWFAREALDELYEHSYYRVRCTALVADAQLLQTVGPAVDRICLLADQIASGWKNRQLEIAMQQVLVHRYEPVAQNQLAKELGMKPQQLFASAKAMGLSAFLDGKRTAQLLLSERTKEHER
jgi:hypothetical protein